AAVQRATPLDHLTKPRGSLGRLEELAQRLAAISGRFPPEIRRPVIFTLAADHGVVAEGVSAYPQIVTAQMVENFLRGGAAVNVLARDAGARVVVADFGVANPLPRSDALVDRRLGAGTANMAHGPAMAREQALAALEAGGGGAEGARAAGADPPGARERGDGQPTSARAPTPAPTGLPVGAHPRHAPGNR